MYIFDDFDQMDLVRNKYDGVTGTVIGIYMSQIDGHQRVFLDVRTDRRVHYNTPSINWERLGKGDA